MLPVIECRSVSKKFRRQPERLLLRQQALQWLHRRATRQDFYALRNVSFTVQPGESLAIIGRNGAGKSTLLSLATGLAQPDEGSLFVRGRVAALLELGAGFHFDLTGAENLHLNAALLGLSRKETERLVPAIVEFADIGEFIDEPLRTYSSGMVLRLAFSVAANLNPDILIVDEILAVGDQTFQAKCLDRIREFRRAGKTILCVSHALPTLLELCDQALWLDHGEVVMQGNVRAVSEAYCGRQPLSNEA